MTKGEVFFVSPDKWENPNKPVLRDRLGHPVKGTGRVKGSKIAAIASKESAATRRKSYQELKERYLNPGDERDVDAIISFKELTDHLISACLGSQQYVSCPHEECNEKHLVAFKKDANVLFKLWENLTGRARETQDINVASQSLIAILQERTPINAIEVHTIDPAEERRRREVLSA